MAEVEAWAAGLAEVHARIAPRFARSAAERAGLRAGTAGAAGAVELLDVGRACRLSHPGLDAAVFSLLDWDADAVRDDVRDYVVEHLATPAGCWWSMNRIPQEGHQVRRRRSSVLRYRRSDLELPDRGVPGLRHTGRTHVLGRELYLPKTWAEDHERARRRGSVRRWSSRPNRSWRWPCRPRAGRAGAGRWVTGDEVYGQHSRLRGCSKTPDALRHGGSGQPAGDRATQREGPRARADALAAQLSPGLEENLRRSQRQEPALVPLGPRLDPSSVVHPQLRLLVRRSLTDPDDLSYYLCHGPERTPLL